MTAFACLRRKLTLSLSRRSNRGEVSFPRPILRVPKLKNSNHDFLRSGLLKMKNQTDDDVFELVKEKRNFDRPVRENFICGACGQQGHMRTNKNCPKYGEEIESILKSAEPETPKSPLRLMAEWPPSRQFESSSVKKLKITPAETSESSEQLGPRKALPLKLKCPSEKSLDRYISDTETGAKPAVKINKIILSNKVKSENGQNDPPKTILFAKPPPEVSESDPPRKKLIIKHSKAFNDVEHGKAFNDVDEVRNSIGFGIDDNFKKTKRMVELSGFDSYGKQDVRFGGQGIGAHTAVSEDRRFWEMEEKRRNNRLEEEKFKRMYEEERMQQQRQIEFLRYEEALVNGRERAKAKKKKKKKTKMTTDDYLDELDNKNRAAKKRNFIDLGHNSAEVGTYPKRRRGGEVALSNILETIVDGLRDKRALSYIFLKPVSKKEAPDYLDIIDTPMDLSTVRDKVRKMEYRNRREFRRDVWQISVNAHRYNDQINPGIPPLADQLLRFCDHLLQENQKLLDDAETGIEQWT